jgi:hypothetical protein
MESINKACKLTHQDSIKCTDITRLKEAFPANQVGD